MDAFSNSSGAIILSDLIATIRRNKQYLSDIDGAIHSFGGYGVMEIPNMQALMRRICKQGFEHHVAVSLSQKAAAINEALSTYMGWNVYLHA